MRLYIEGHSVKMGYAITPSLSDDECSQQSFAASQEVRPVRFLANRRRAIALVTRWNRRFATE